jgi:hypothetical protein
MSRLDEGQGKIITVVNLRPAPFRMRFPRFAPHVAVEVCAWRDDSIFSLDDKETTEDVEFLGRGKGLADSEFGDGVLKMTPKARGYYIGNRIADGPDNMGEIFFTDMWDLVSQKRAPLTQQEDDIFLTVYVNLAREKDLTAADSEHDFHRKGHRLRSHSGSQWYEYVILRFH